MVISDEFKEQLETVVRYVIENTDGDNSKWNQNKEWKKYMMASAIFCLIAKVEKKVGFFPNCDFINMFATKLIDIDREWILETFNTCIKAVEGNYSPHSISVDLSCGITDTESVDKNS